MYSGGGLFSWGTKFKYAGRTEREILERDGLLPPREHAVSAGGLFVDGAARGVSARDVSARSTWN